MRLAAASLVGLLTASGARAQELPLRTWGVRDGLTQSRVNDILRDSAGYVWFATWDGVSRFDGRNFLDYGTLQGLPNPLVWCLAEGPDGTVWLGTHGGGLARVADTGRELIAVAPGESPAARRVFDLAFDGAGRLWVVTEAGLYCCRDARAEVPQFEFREELGAGWFGLSCVDSASRLWFVDPGGVVACRGDELQSIADVGGRSSAAGELRAVLRRRAGGVWVAHARALFALELPGPDSPRGTCSPVEFEFDAGATILDLCEDDAGRLWLATSRGLACIDGATTRWFTSQQGLPDDWIRALEADPRGGLWIGTHQGGAALLSDTGVERYTARGGLGDGHAVSLVRSDSDSWIVATELTGLFELDGGRARLVPGSDRAPFDRVQHQLLCEPGSGWWLGTREGLFRVAGPALDLERAELQGESAGLPPGASQFIARDGAGRVLVGDAAGGVFARTAHAARFERLPVEFSVAPLRAFAQTSDGTDWFSDGHGMWRSRAGRIERVDLDVGRAADAEPRVLHADRRGWLWVGMRFGGLAWTREPAADEPVFERLGAREGLASDVVLALVEDREGALYLGTGRGIQRYRPEARTLEAIGEDEIASEWIMDLELEDDEALWAACGRGVVRIPLPAARPEAEPARVRFTHCIAGGNELVLPGRGALEGPALELAARDSDLLLEYVAVDPIHGPELRYQTRMQGLEQDWSPPTADLSVRFGSLPAGRYRFEVRSLTPGSGRAGAPSGLEIQVVPPLWQRPWALALALGAAVAAGWLSQRVRSRRELELERLRLRIAEDLHDDLGAGLAGIAITSELARRAEVPRAGELMGEVAQLARDLRGSMGDLVWAIDPQQDGLDDVVGRLRQVCGEALNGPGQALEFRAPLEGELARRELAPDRRRQLVLFLKEALANVARHARAAHVRVELAARGERLRLSIEDDGCGFDPAAPREGRGLGNLRRRAHDLGGRLDLSSAPGAGTRVALDIPLRGGRET